MRLRRLMGTSRKPPMGWTQRGPGVRRRCVPSGLLEPGPRCRSTPRQASVRERRVWKQTVVFLDVDSTNRRTVVTLSNEWRKSHWCLKERHHASIMEFENFSSVKASTRRSTPVRLEFVVRRRRGA